jgi:hypothetical protein
MIIVERQVSPPLEGGGPCRLAVWVSVPFLTHYPERLMIE